MKVGRRSKDSIDYAEKTVARAETSSAGAGASGRLRACNAA